MSAVLSVEKLTKHYGAIQALKGVSFDVPKGSVFGILGPNGSGKTTLLGIVMNVLKPTSGSFSFNGKEADAETRRQVGTLLETPNFYHYLSGERNLRIAAEKSFIDKDVIGEADFIINLAGANVAEGRWTAKRKKELLDSRVNSGDTLLKALHNFPNKVSAIISASAQGWYGADAQVPNPRPFEETDPANNDFLGTVCQAWEAAIQPVVALNKRLVIFRIGIVLSIAGGAYAEFRKPVQFGTAAILGNGKQVVSWIHIQDLVRLFVAAVENDQWNGIYNAVAPHPVSNKTLVLEIARQRSKFYLPVHAPSFALKLALGEMSIEVLKSVRLSSSKTEATGFSFLYPTIGKAVSALEQKA